MENMRKINTRHIVLTGVVAAIIAVLSQISIPMPSGVPVTLQTFAIAFCGFFLGAKLSVVAVGVYIMLGAVGVPVFSNFGGGVGVLVAVTGGFIWGFLPMAFMCGIKTESKWLSVLFGIIGLLICHLCGVLQFSAVSLNGFIYSVTTVSLPYMIKDIVSVAAAYFVALKVRERIKI